MWREGPKFPYFHLIHPDTDYVFTSVTSDAKKEEFHDEARRLCDLHLFVAFLKLVEPNASTKQENILNSQLSNSLQFVQCLTILVFFSYSTIFFSASALGIKVNKLDELESIEVMEYRREVVNLCKEIVDLREATPEDHAYYAYSAQVCPTKAPKDLFRDGTVVLKVCIDSTRTLSTKMPKEANAETIVRETLETTAKKHGPSGCIGMSSSDFVLKICGREEYLLGSFPISKYKVGPFN